MFRRNNRTEATTVWALAIVLAMGFSGAGDSQAAAQDEGDGSGREQRQQRAERPGDRGDGRSVEDHPALTHSERGWQLIRARLMRDIKLTDSQWQRVDRTFEDLQQQARQWHSENREELRELMQSFREVQRENRQQLAALRERSRELLERRPGLDELSEALEDVLDDDQWQRFRENRRAVSRAITQRLEEFGRQFRRGETQTPDAESRRPPEGQQDRRAMRRAPMPGRPGGPLFEGIDLSEEQRQQVRDAMEAHRQRHSQWMEEHRQRMSDLGEQMRQARQENDRQQLRELREKVRELREDRPSVQELHERLRDVLDEQQWKQFEANRQDMHERMRQRRQEEQAQGQTRVDENE